MNELDQPKTVSSDLVENETPRDLTKFNDNFYS